MRIPWVLLAAAVGLCWAQAPKTNPFAGDRNAAETGRMMFRGSCAPCHGIRAEGGKGPDLTLGTYSHGDSDSDLFNVIFNGAGGTEMPDFGARLDADDIWRLVSYIRSLARRETATLRGNRESGEKLFWGKGQCSQCHRIRDKGGRMGPDLTVVGRLRSLAYLKESLLDPGADITSGYPTVTVVTKDGKKIVGAQRGYDNFSAQLMDTSDNFYSFLRSDVTSVKREFKSLMPAYRGTFSDAELDDLLAYLVSLRGEGKR
ncbi:MAG: c-type cytochrome [Acidobacteria bacterium]|nr:c-type cytochrome [Acidobacteriota bacterium]